MISALVQADLASEKINGKLKHYIPHGISEWYEEIKGGAVASRLARSTPERALRVRALAGTLCCVLGQDTLLSRCLSPPRCINGYRRI